MNLIKLLEKWFDRSTKANVRWCLEILDAAAYRSPQEIFNANAKKNGVPVLLYYGSRNDN